MRYGVAGFAAFVGVVLSVSTPVGAQPETPEYTVALEELIEGTEAYLAEYPEDGGAHIQLGLLHCYAYGYGWEFVQKKYTRVVDGNMVVAGITDPPIHSTTFAFPVTQSRLRHLGEAIPLLRTGVALTPEGYLGQLALGYAYMQTGRGSNLGDFLNGQVSYDVIAAENLGSRTYWEREAVAVLRTARALEDTDRPYPLAHGGQLACLYLYQILASRASPTTEDADELEAVRDCADTAASSKVKLPAVNGEPISRGDGSVSESALREILAIYPFIPENQNGAEYLLHAIDAAVHIDYGRDAPIPYIGGLELRLPAEPFSEEMLGLMAHYLACNKESLRSIHEADRFRSFRYPVDLRLRWGMNLNHAARLRGLVELSGMQALYAAERGDAYAAVQSLVDSMAVVRSLSREPLMLSQLARMGYAGRAVHATEQVVNRVVLSDSGLRRLQEALATLESENGAVIGLTGERWMVAQPKPNDDAAEAAVEVEKVKAIYREKGVERQFHFEPSPHFPELDEITVSEEEKEAMEAKLRKEYAAKTREWLAVLDRYLEIARLPVQQIHSAIEIPEEAGPGVPLHRMSNPYDTYSKFLNSHVRTVAHLRVAQVALAVERYFARNGEVPTSLPLLAPDFVPHRTLLDPFTGETLQFVVSEDRYVVLSAGDPRINSQMKESDPKSPGGISFTVMWR